MGGVSEDGSSPAPTFLEEWARQNARYVQTVRAMIKDTEEEKLFEDEALNEIAEIERRVSQKRNEIRSRNGGALYSTIAGFWLTAMKAEPTIRNEISSCDEEALKHLKNITVDRLSLAESKGLGQDCIQGYRLTFTFEPNGFMVEEKLVKTMGFVQEEGFNALVPQIALGCDIEWKGESLTTKAEAKGTTSFFHLFSSTTDEETTEMWDSMTSRTPRRGRRSSSFSGSSDEEDQIPPEDEWRDIERHHDTCEALVDRLIPFAVYYFTGEAHTWPGYVSENDDEDDDDDENDPESADGFGRPRSGDDFSDWAIENSIRRTLL